MARSGVIRAGSLDEAIEMIEIVTHLGVPIGRNIGALSLSGAFRGILVDGAAGSGLKFPPLAADVERRLAALLGVGSSAGNPADGGFTVLTSVEKYIEAVDILCDDPGLDVLVLQAELPRETGMAAHWEERFQGIHDLVSRRGKKLCFISMFSRMYTDYTRQVRAGLPNVAFVHETNKSVRALAALAGWSNEAKRRNKAPPAAPPKPRALPEAAKAALQKAERQAGMVLLNERDSKALLGAYGIAGTREAIAATEDEAVRIAAGIGYPVVLKAASDRIAHKSDIGAVKLGLGDEAALRSAYRAIIDNVARAGFKDDLDGMLVSEQIDGGIELVIGLQRDPEMGLVVMAGSGGVLLELVRDVAFAPVPLTRDNALELVRSTRMAKLLDGYRGTATHDLGRIADAMTALSDLARDLGDAIVSIDINPLVSRAGATAPVALDAVVCLAGKET
jgi:acetyltransferase